LGCYPTRGEAVKRLRQIEYFKHQGAVLGSFKVVENPNDPRNQLPEPTKPLTASNTEEAIKNNIIGKLDLSN